MNTSKTTKTIIFSVGILVASITLVIYLTALNNDFVNWDDHTYVCDNQNIKSLNVDLLKWSFSSSVASHWHPLTMLSLALDYALWGLDPWGYHLTNIIIHVVNTFLVLIVAVFLFRLRRPAQEDKGRDGIFVGFLTALFFGIHPLHVESVAWISERKDVLSGLFWLLSLLSYLTYASRANSRRTIYSVSLIFFFLALMSKPMAVTLPLVFLLLDFYPLGRLNGVKELWGKKWVLAEKLPFLFLSMSASFMAIWVHETEGALGNVEIFPLSDRIFVALNGYLFYLQKMLFPVGLAAFYPYPSYNIKPLSLEFIGLLALMSSITVLAVLSLKRNKIFFVTWLYYLITLLPVIGIIQVGRQAAADRYTYLPSLGPFFLASLGISVIYAKRNGRFRVKAIVALAALSFFLTLVTVRQICIWQNSITLWSRVIRIFPDHPFGYDYRSRGHYGNNDFQLAVRDMNTAVKIEPKNPEHYYKLGKYHSSLGNVQESLINLSKAIDLDARHAKAYFSRGFINISLGNYPLAIEDLDAAIRLDPKNSKAFYGRGFAFLKSNENQRAISDFNAAIKLEPQYAEAYNSRANAYKNVGALKEALRDYSRAIEIRPDDAIVYNNRGVLYGNLGNFTQAINDSMKAIELRSDYAEPHYNLGKVFSQLGKSKEAEEYYNKADALGLKLK